MLKRTFEWDLTLNFVQTDPEETIVQLEPGLDISEDRCEVK